MISPNEPPELNLGSECWVLCFIVFQNPFYYGCRFKFLVFQISLKTRKIDRWVSHLRVGKVDDRQAFDVQSIHKNVTEGKVAVRYCPNLVRTLLQFLKSLFETRHLKTWFMLSETLQAAPRLLEFELQVRFRLGDVSLDFVWHILAVQKCKKLSKRSDKRLSLTLTHGHDHLGRQLRSVYSREHRVKPFGMYVQRPGNRNSQILLTQVIRKYRFLQQ